MIRWRLINAANSTPAGRPVSLVSAAISRVHASWRFLVAPRGSRQWDLMVRSIGIVALLGIPLTLAFPRLVPLTWLAVLSLPASGPLGPVLPAALEPLVMEAAKYEEAIWVTLVALSTYIYMEFVNWHIYAWVLNRAELSRLRDHRRVRSAVRFFARAPFWTVAVIAATPFPCWVVRVLAVLHNYPMRPYLVATAIGRFPRIYLYAWLGAVLRVPTVVLVGIIVGSGVVVIVNRFIRKRREAAVGDLVPASGSE